MVPWRIDLKDVVVVNHEDVEFLLEGNSIKLTPHHLIMDQPSGTCSTVSIYFIRYCNHGWSRSSGAILLLSGTISSSSLSSRSNMCKPFFVVFDCMDFCLSTSLFSWRYRALNYNMLCGQLIWERSDIPLLLHISTRHLEVPLTISFWNMPSFPLDWGLGVL